MDARDLLRQYLEQRRELGERELVLDSMSVEEALRAIGASPRPPDAGPAVPELRRRSVDDSDAGDWRAALRAAGAAPPGPPPPSVPAAPTAAEAAVPAPAPASPPAHDAEPREGIVVGSASTELFGGPLSSIATLADLAREIAACGACGLHATARNAVPGEGNPDADFVCVGEAPGEQEDATGRPFVGQAGKLLTQILEAIQLKRDDVFICNVLKHRPPGNRNPAPDEILACRPFLHRQLEMLKPKVILALGTFAAQTLLDTKLAMGKLRGQIHRFYGVPLIVTYHPAALLRNPAWKRPTWEDVKLARRLLDRARDGA